MKNQIICLFLTFILAGLSYSVMLTGDPLAEKPELCIQRSDDRMIEFNFTFPGVTSKDVLRGSRVYDLLEVEGEGVSGTIGTPEVPIITRLFAIPDQMRVKIKKLEPVYQTYQGISPYPHQEYEYDSPYNTGDWVFEGKYYEEGEFFPEKWVTLSDPAIMRDFRIIPVNISPVRVNAKTGEAQVLKGLHLELEFDNGPTTNIKTHHFDRVVGSFNKMYRNLISNYDWVSPNGENLKGSLLIIYPNVTGVSNILQPYIEWKQRLGYATTAISVPNGADTTMVKNIIQEAYDTYYPPLEAVVIVGDAAGALDIDCFYYLGYTNGASDHQYALLEGDDILADIIIGRISVDGLAQLQTAINKILYYEKDPTLAPTDWYEKGAVVAGSSNSGISTIQINHTIRSWWLEDGLTQVDTMWYNIGGSIPTFITNQCNSGISALNFSGYIGCSGFSVTNVMNLINTGKLPLAAFITSGTGNFGSSGSSMSEAWLRAGSPTNPTGGIGGIGVSAETHTRYYNTFDLGLWVGLHTGETTSIGAMTFRGKYELYLTYQLDPSGMACQTYWTNLMGDPTTELWTDVPQQLIVEYPDSIPLGTSSFTVAVADTAGNPLPDRYVTLWKGAETYIGSRTDDNGIFTAPINTPTAGNMFLTVTYHNDYPYLGTIPVFVCDVNPSYNGLMIDDDSIPPSIGNGDGFANPGEILELDVQLKNFGTITTATGISASLTSPDSGANITLATINYPNLAPNTIAYGEGKFVVELDSYFNEGYLLPFSLTANSAQGTFTSAFNIPVRSGQSEVINAVFSSGILSPGETDSLTVTLRNIGQMNLTSVTATLSTTDDQITIIDNQGSFGNINAGQAVNNSGDAFSIQAEEFATDGHSATLNMHIASSEGFEQDLEFEIVIGQISADDPMGPDNYDYYCVDNTDVEYSGHPIYNWVEINQIGTLINLPDYGNQQDASTCVLLPFDFTFYGETSDTLTVCSNGWLALGDQTYFTDFRNYPMPSAAGANGGMICPLWDDLVMGYGHVYYWNDEINHRFIVEYYNVSYMYSGGTLRFETILYDPTFYPTPTGDGEIVFQYNAFNPNQGPYSDNPYWTTGIENHDHTVGLQYAYWNTYEPGAAPLCTGRAIKFTTIEPLRTPQPLTVEVTIAPVNPPIIIPVIGGGFEYDITAANTGIAPTIFDLWIKALLPSGTYVGPLLNVQNLEFAGGQVVSRIKQQYVPGSAPAGIYTYIAYVGDYPTNTIWDSSYFNFTKLGMDLGGDGGWGVTGWDEENSTMDLPDKCVLNWVKPNPFNLTTTISFDLPKAGKVSLVVYNLQGREITVLEDAYLNAGSYKREFDGTNLPSGLYFVRLKTRNYENIVKMVLVK